MAIANALQLEAAQANPVLCRFYYDVMPTLKSLNLSIAVLERFTADTLLYAVTLTLTFDLEHLQRIACDVMKLRTRFERDGVSSNPRAEICRWEVVLDLLLRATTKKRLSTF